MSALGIYRAGLHSCGLPLAETTAPDAEFAYKVGPPHRCHACTAVLRAQKADERTEPEALLWRAERR